MLNDKYEEFPFFVNGQFWKKIQIPSGRESWHIPIAIKRFVHEMNTKTMTTDPLGQARFDRKKLHRLLRPNRDWGELVEVFWCDDDGVSLDDDGIWKDR